MSDYEERALALWDEFPVTAARDGVSVKRKVVTSTEFSEAALKLGQEMADARAEEIAQMIASFSLKDTHAPTRAELAECVLAAAAKIARSFIAKPKTREQVLEEALREIEPLTTNETWQQEAIRKSDVARRALEWKS